MRSGVRLHFSYLVFKLFKNTLALALLKLVASGDLNESVVCHPIKSLNQSYPAILLPSQDLGILHFKVEAY